MSGKINENPLTNLRVLLAGFKPSDAIAMEENLLRLEVEAVNTISDVKRAVSAEKLSEIFNAVIFNIRAFEDTEEAVDSLLDFRLKFPEISVILVLPRTGNDDFGPERSPICDATLRSPVNESRLKQALESGLLHTAKPKN